MSQTQGRIGHYGSAYMSEEVGRVCLNCPHGRCIDVDHGCKKYREVEKRVKAADTRHKGNFGRKA